MGQEQFLCTDKRGKIRASSFPRLLANIVLYLSAAMVCQKRPANEHLIGSVAANLVVYAADNGVYQRCDSSHSLFLWCRLLPTCYGTIPCRRNASRRASKASAAGCRRTVVDRMDRRASLALLASSLVYSLMLGGIEGSLGTMQIQGRSDVQNSSSCTHLVRGAVPL